MSKFVDIWLYAFWKIILNFYTFFAIVKVKKNSLLLVDDAKMLFQSLHNKENSRVLEHEERWKFERFRFTPRFL